MPEELKMKKRILLGLMLSVIVASVLLSACAPAATKDMFYAEPPALGMPEERVASDAAGGFGGGSVAVVDQVAAQRLVIRNANLSIVIDDPEAEMNAISALAERMGGFVVSSYLYQSTLANGMEVPSASITIRVPAESFEAALTTIKADAKTVLTENKAGQDVTAEYTDLQSRLRNLQDAEVLLRQIMQEATKTEDILNAFNQLNAITEQIEVLKGQIKYYEESAAMSAISVELIASQAVQPITIGGWEPVGVAKDAIQALVNALQGIVNALIWLALYVLPIALIIGVPGWFVVRGLRRLALKRSKSQTIKRRK
jgi:uncharacterized protein DUF4349